MRYVEAPSEYDGNEPSIFLAGGISGCDDWQQVVAGRLAGSGVVVLNPRRRHMGAGDEAAAAQIAWEFRHLRRATARLFWFPPPAVCPIALYELGAWSMRPDPLFVGTDRAYGRRFDVVTQTRLARPDIRVADSIDELAAGVLAWHAATATTGDA